MNLIYFSKGVRGEACLRAVIKAGYQVSAVVAVSPEDDLISLGETYDFPILLPERINGPDTVQELKSFEADCFVLSGYNKILKSAVINIPPLGTINLHGGKLPQYRGAAPINWQIINGETSGGCCIIYVDEGIDTGDIIAQEKYPINSEDTHASILEKSLRIFPKLLVKVLKNIEEGTVQAQPQDLAAGCYYTRRYPRDSVINWERMTDKQVHNLVRGMHGPYPAAFTYRGGEKVEINRTRLLEDDIKGVPGRVPLIRGASVVVLAANRGIVVEEIRVAEKKLDPADYFQIGDDLKRLTAGGS
jgi:methionyl-tRNA formyltransferase